MATARIKYIDSFRAPLTLELLEKRVPENLRRIKENATQSAYYSAASDFRRIGLFRYGLGAPLSQVKTALIEALPLYKMVVNLRGTELGIPSINVRVGEDVDIQKELSRDNRSTDFSLGNSVTSYNWLCIALAVQQWDLAKDIAVSIREPSEMYIARDSRIGLTPEAVSLAFGVRDLFSNRKDSAIQKFKVAKSFENERTFLEASLFLSFALKDIGEFRRDLTKLIEWHSQAAPRKENKLDCDYFINFVVLGLSAYAMNCQLVEFSALPSSSEYYPKDLINVT